MTSLQFRHHLTRIRCSQHEPATRSDIAVEARISSNAIKARLVAPRAIQKDDIESVAETARADLTRQLPASAQRDLVVEAGRVHQTMSLGKNRIYHQQHPYLLITCRGSVFTLVEKLSYSPSLKWTTVVGADEISKDMPVLLDASAVLGLIQHYLETAGCDRDRISSKQNSSLSITEAERSPYPPHALPRIEFDELRTKTRSGVSDCIDQTTFKQNFEQLLLRPEWLARPFAALEADKIGSLTIDCKAATTMPDRAFIIDALTPLAAWPGAIGWEAEFSLLSQQSRRVAGASSLLLRFDPQKIIASIRGAIGKNLPALVRDPVAGDRYGLAPMLLTDLQAGDLL